MIRAALAALLLATPLAAQQPTSVAPGALLRGLDKISGQTVDFELRPGQRALFGRLTIQLNECRFPEGSRASDAFAGLQISEEGKPEPIFNGWMIASAPALSALDHPRYDVWVIRCAAT